MKKVTSHKTTLGGCWEQRRWEAASCMRGVQMDALGFYSSECSGRHRISLDNRGKQENGRTLNLRIGILCNAEFPSFHVVPIQCITFYIYSSQAPDFSFGNSSPAYCWPFHCNDQPSPIKSASLHKLLSCTDWAAKWLHASFLCKKGK